MVRFTLPYHPAGILISVATMVCFAATVFADQLPGAAWQQMPPQTPGAQSSAPLWTPDQLRNLVAPVALYPDPLLGQILAASTYPLEIVEAQQWQQQNPGIAGQALMDALKQQGWDPSVQMLAEFPEAMALLNRDVRWTTDLGNAFLSQQADVMNAIQYLRMEARGSGRLQSSPQQIVSTETENGQSAVSIEPANPQVVYPPVYSPVSVWGPPASGSYPAFSYAPSPYYGAGYGNGIGGGGYGFGNGIDIGGLFSGLLNWNGWGWVLGWFTHSLSLASLFFNILGSHGFGSGGIGAGFHTAGGVGAMALWSHDASHRLGVPYPRGFSAAAQTARGFSPMRENSSRMVASVSPSSVSRALNPNPIQQQRYNEPQRFSQMQHFTDPQRYNQPIRSSEPQRYSSSNYSHPNYSPQRYSSPQNFAPSRSAQQNFSEQKFQAPKYSEPRYSAQRFSAPKFPAPKFSAPKAPKSPKMSAPKSSGGHSSGKSHKH